MIEEDGGSVFDFTCDLCQKSEVYATAKKIKGKIGFVDILINNAGYVSGNYLLDTPDGKYITRPE